MLGLLTVEAAIATYAVPLTVRTISNMQLKQLLFIFVAFSSVSCKTDYCKLEKDPKICRGNPHTGCTGTGLPFPSKGECSNKHSIEMTPERKRVLLREHNSWRNELAGGHIRNFPFASRMMKVHWNEELAFLSQKHVEHCVFEHDMCRGTDEYPMSGQNIALKMYSHPNKDDEQMMKEMCAEWFEEYELVPKSEIRTLVNEYHHSSIYGHFFAMAREQNHAVGCALVSMENTVLLPQVPYHFMLTCNYAETNVLRSSVYDQGKPGSRCDSFGSNYKLEANDCNNLCDIPKENPDETRPAVNGTDLLLEQVKLCYKRSPSTGTRTTTNQGLPLNLSIVSLIVLII